MIQNSVPNQPPTSSLSRSPSTSRNETEFSRPSHAEHGRVRQQRHQRDRQERDQHERVQLLLVGELPPPAPAGHVLRRRLEDVAGRLRVRLGLTGHRAGQARDVRAHAEALVPDPVALHQVLPAAGAREDQRREHQREPELGRELRVRHALAEAPPGVGVDGEHERDDEEQQHEADLEELDPLEDGVDHRRQRERHADDQQHADRDPARLAAGQIGDHRRRAGHPARPEVREIGEDREHQAPVPPRPGEPGQRRLAGGQRVALDLHVEEPLGDQADHRGPQEDQTDLRGDVREQDELARGQADPGRDHPRPDDRPRRARRVRQVTYGDCGQVTGGEAVGGRLRHDVRPPGGDHRHIPRRLAAETSP